MNKQYGYVISASLLYGAMPLLVKQILALNVEAQMVVNLRFLFSAVILLAYSLLTKRHICLTKKQYVQVLFLGVGGFGMAGLLLTLSYSYLAAGVATVFHFTAPLFVNIILFLIFKEPISKKKLISILFALFGLMLVFYSVDQISVKGVLLAASSGLFYAIYMVSVQKSELHKIDGTVIVFHISLLSGILFSLYSCINNTFILPSNLDAYILLWINALFCTVLPMCLITISVQKIGSLKTAVVNMLEPITSVILGILLLQEARNELTVMGIVLVLGSILAVILDQEKTVS